MNNPHNMQANHIQQQQASIRMSLKGMKAELYRAAKSGSFEDMSSISSNWKHQETPSRNNILHIHVGKPLRKKKTKTWDPMVYTEFIEKVVEDEEGYRLLWNQNSNGDNPLHLAAKFGHSNAVEAFLERAKRVNEEEVIRMLKVTNKRKDTALHEAARAGHGNVVKLLVEADPNCSSHNEPNVEGEIPLYLAAERGHAPSVLSILQTCSAEHLAYKGPCGRTALHAAVQWGEPGMGSLSLSFHVFQFDHRLFNSTAVYVQDNMGRTPLHIAMLRENCDAIKKLMESCPDCIEIVDNKGQNVLHYAAKWTCCNVLYWILEISGDLDKLINDKDVDGNTPLHILAASIPDAPILHPCMNFLPDFVKSYPTLNLKAFNKENLTVGDILLSSDHLLRKERLLEKSEVPRGRRINTYERDVDIEKATIDYRFGEWDADLLKKAAESRLVVAALIATVSFTAGFTAVPGGFDQNAGKNMGLALLKSKLSFIVFLISDAIAFTSSTLSIISYFVLVSTNTKWAIQNLSFWALITNIISLGALMVAFLAGVTAVLSRSVALIVSIYAICAAFMYGYIYLTTRTYSIAKYWRHRFYLRNYRVHH